MNANEKFFYDNAGYSYDPSTETKEQGRTRGARELAKAEAWAKAAGYEFRWELDDTDSSEFSDERPFYRLWACFLNKDGIVRQSLFGIDLGRNSRDEQARNYKRVVCAELALAEMAEQAARIEQARTAMQDARRECLALLKEARHLRKTRPVGTNAHPHICAAVRIQIDSLRAIIAHNRKLAGGAR